MELLISSQKVQKYVTFLLLLPLPPLPVSSRTSLLKCQFSQIIPNLPFMHLSVSLTPDFIPSISLYTIHRCRRRLYFVSRRESRALIPIDCLLRTAPPHGLSHYRISRPFVLRRVGRPTDRSTDR